MGFSSTFTIQHYSNYSTQYPAWFVEKWKHLIVFDNGSLIHPMREFKFDHDLVFDIQKAIDFDNFNLDIVMVFLHECGGITRCQIGKDYIIYSEPDSWGNVDNPSHNYCYGCSDATQNT